MSEQADNRRLADVMCILDGLNARTRMNRNHRLDGAMRSLFKAHEDALYFIERAGLRVSVLMSVEDILIKIDAERML